MGDQHQAHRWASSLGAAMCVLLASCGGGGGGEASQSPAPTPAPAPETAPAPAPGASASPAPAPVPAPPASAPVAPAPPPLPAARVANIELAQTMLYGSADPELVLVADKAVLVKVNVITPNAAEDKPAGTLRVETASGALVQAIPLIVPPSPLPSAVAPVPSLSNAYSAVVPATLVKSGLRLSVTLENGRAPVTINPRVGGGVSIRMVAVPIQIAGTTGQVANRIENHIQTRMPVAGVTLQTHAPYVSNSVTSVPTTEAQWEEAFRSILLEVSKLYTSENPDEPQNVFYYGFLPKRTSGLLGMGYTPGRAAVGFDLVSNASLVLETVTHELGHNIGLSHAPCGPVTNPDPAYPYANAQLGAPGRYIWGYMADTRTFVDPRRSDLHDMMSYCDGSSFSDYNYRNLQIQLTPSDQSVRAAAAANENGPQELILVSGQIDAQRGVVLKPVKTLFGQTRAPKPGVYSLRITTTQGTLEYPFTAQQIDHAVGVQHFAFTLPNPGPITSMSLLRGGRVLMTSTAPPATKDLFDANVRPEVQVSEQGGELRLGWDADKYTYLTVTHVGEHRTTLAQDLKGGSATLSAAGLPAGGSFELSLSDGLNAMRVVKKR
jgi:hypothetical protein